jgi:hypothetical protein
MLNRFAKITFAASLLVGAFATGCTVTTSDDSGDASLKIVNDESFDIDNIYISPSGFDQSDDILGGIPLDNGDSITISVECDSYDIEIIDTVSDCYISAYSLCGTDDEWDITDSFIEECSATEPRTSSTPRLPATNASTLAK